MKTTTENASSIVLDPTLPKRRMTKQSVQILDFIHRFRHVTSRHIQVTLQHPPLNITNKQLSTLRAKGYIDRKYTTADRATNQWASYYLTLEGLAVLKAKYPTRKFRGSRSIEADAKSQLAARQQCHTLADVYVHFKHHYNGQFELFTGFDITGLNYMPDDMTPDAYIRIKFPTLGTLHYFIEVHGWNRPTYIQQRRLHSYLSFAESGVWEDITGNSTLPSLFIITGSRASQRRVNAQMKLSLEDSLAENFAVHTTAVAKLTSETADIWRQI